jgi:hypothetical protein
MASSFKVASVTEAVSRRLYPSVTTFNRLEGRPRTINFDRALKAEVRDALWMLTKQWQMGEFSGSDAGSPVFARLQVDTTQLSKYRPAALATELFDESVPLEAKVERRPIPFGSTARPLSLDIRLLMGRQWMKLIDGIGAHQADYIAAYPVVAPDPTKASDADRCAHPEVWQMYAAVAGRAMDGAGLYQYLMADPSHHAYDGITTIAAEQSLIDQKAARFIAWFNRQFFQPPQSGDDAWLPSHLEYQFAASAPEQTGEKVYTADAYYQGRLDWYSLDVDVSMAALPAVAGAVVTPPASNVQTVIPTPVSFAGMPSTRWWTFEDGKTNFGDISPSTTDVPKLMFMEFALVYANDWFVIPYTLPSGSLATVRGMVVTDVFGQQFWIASANQGADSNWQRWSFFTINVEGSPGAAAETTLLLLPTVPKIQESAPTEETMLIRDEVSNMVWGIEKTILLPTGDSKPGPEAAVQTRAFFTSLVAAGPPAAPIPAAAAIEYQLMTSVPENWIPFIPVHSPGSNRTIQLQRAAMPRVIEGDPAAPVPVAPRTVLLRQGLDFVPQLPYFVFEEEVPRAGATLTQKYQRTRWTDGSVFTWLRVRRQTGRGEGSSGLAFDEIIDVGLP